MHQEIPLTDPLIILDQQFHHVAGDFRRDGHRVAFGIGVIGGFLVAAGKPEPQADDQHHDHHDGQDNQRLFAGAFALIAAVVITAPGVVVIVPAVVLPAGVAIVIPVVVLPAVVAIAAVVVAPRGVAIAAAVIVLPAVILCAARPAVGAGGRGRSAVDIIVIVGSGCIGSVIGFVAIHRLRLLTWQALRQNKRKLCH